MCVHSKGTELISVYILVWGNATLVHSMLLSSFLCVLDVPLVSLFLVMINFTVSLSYSVNGLHPGALSSGTNLSTNKPFD